MIEHVVLYRFKPETEPSQIAATINGLNGLVSINEVVHLSAGPLLRAHSSSSSLSFTHMLHCRYNSQDDLKAYAVHPAHVSLVNRTSVLLDDIMAVDWIWEDASAPAPGSVSKVVFLKLKDNLAHKEYVLEVIRETCNKFSSICQFSFGENFSLNRAKGFSIAILMVFDGVEVLDSSAEIMNLLNEKLKDLVEDDLVLDCIIGTPQSDSSST
ncbi:stress-response A/B barrel domain-containing protein UP3 [Heracleum sosnowskyi]|uniref:Stress-response A/B barrel domain-containing protein UP3 n=1 Tax=Heracleum sosnowskyi TaxID=360622 RepID=A0AAD8MYZ2_9APIA|nr:stress-response A/B barrel domain-containing protein UP3 [Heracleum sosnowskyi]